MHASCSLHPILIDIFLYGTMINDIKYVYQSNKCNTDFFVGPPTEAGPGLEEWVFKIQNLQKKINWFNTIFLASMFLITID